MGGPNTLLIAAFLSPSPLFNLIFMLISFWLKTCLTSRSARAWTSTFLQGGVTSRDLAVAHSVERRQLQIALHPFCLFFMFSLGKRDRVGPVIISKPPLLSFANKFPPWLLTSKCHTEFPLLCVTLICTGRHNFCSVVAQCGVESLHQGKVSLKGEYWIIHLMLRTQVTSFIVDIFTHYWHDNFSGTIPLISVSVSVCILKSSWTAVVEPHKMIYAGQFTIFIKNADFNQETTTFPGTDCSDGSGVIKIERPRTEEPLPATTLTLCYLSKWKKWPHCSFDKYTSSKINLTSLW